MMHALAAWVVSHQAETVAAIYTAFSFVIGLLPTSAQHARWVGWAVKVLDLASFLAAKDAAGTLKLPGTRSQS